jgi:hypothetical protein
MVGQQFDQPFVRGHPDKAKSRDVRKIGLKPPSLIGSRRSVEDPPIPKGSEFG